MVIKYFMLHRATVAFVSVGILFLKYFKLPEEKQDIFVLFR